MPNVTGKGKIEVEHIIQLGNLINSGDFISDCGDLKLWVDSCILNSCGKTDMSSHFNIFWDGMARVMEMERVDAHHHWHNEGGNIEKTTKMAYAPAINSIQQLKRGKTKGTDFRVPHQTLVYLQLSSTYENHKSVQNHTGVLPFKQKLQSQSIRVDHSHGHWVAMKKKLWRYHGWYLQQLLQTAKDKDHVDVIPWQLGIKFIGQDDKTSISGGREVPVAAT
eukprot:14115310-Ditylum_brightwellii.AAC.1